PGKVLVRAGDQVHYEKKYCAVDPDFFELFTVQFLEGSPEKVLVDANSLVITRTIRDKYFHQQSAVGKSMSISGEWREQTKTVTGVIEDFPAASHFHFSMLGKLAAPSWMESGLDQVWDGYNWYTYVKLHDASSAKAVQGKVGTLLKSNIASDAPTCIVQSLHDIHLQSNIKSEIEPNGNKSFVMLLGFVGAFLLVAVLLNFVNLSLVRALYRSREAGIRKIIGSSAARLYASFTADTMLYLVTASALAVLIVYAFLPFFNTTFGTALRLDRIDDGEMLIIGGVLLILCLLTSAAPAVFFSRVKPARILKGSLPDSDGSMVRNWLLGFQFAVAIAFIAGIVVVNRQMHFMRNQNLGFNAEQLLVVSGFDNQENPQTTKNRFLEIPEILSASFAGTLPGEPNAFFEASTRNSTQRLLMDYSMVDEDYLNTLGVPIVAGRGFSKDFPEDANNFSLIVNETAARMLGINENAPGQEITPNPKSPTPMYFKIVGVIKDYHISSFHEPIKPYLVSASPSGPNLILKINTTNHAALIEKIQAVWK
ncbi:MAG: ABC transporter permease, partial [Bacteroidota bacterium]